MKLRFPDLGPVGVGLAAVHPPLGLLGVALPAVVALAMFAKIDRSFSTPANSQEVSLSGFVQHVPSRCAGPSSVLGTIGWAAGSL